MGRAPVPAGPGSGAPGRLEPGSLRAPLLLPRGLKFAWEVRHIPYQKTGPTLSEILIPEEEAALFKATDNLT